MGQAMLLIRGLGCLSTESPSSSLVPGLQCWGSVVDTCRGQPYRIWNMKVSVCPIKATQLTLSLLSIWPLSAPWLCIINVKGSLHLFCWPHSDLAMRIVVAENQAMCLQHITILTFLFVITNSSITCLIGHRLFLPWHNHLSTHHSPNCLPSTNTCSIIIPNKNFFCCFLCGTLCASYHVLDTDERDK